MTANDLGGPDGEVVRALLNELPDLVITVDGETGLILGASAHGLARLGWEEDDVKGRPLIDFVHPGDVDDVNPVVAERLASGETVRYDGRLLTAFGPWSIHSFAVRCIDAASNTLLYVARELTSLSYTKRRVDDILKLAELSDDGFLVTDGRGRIRFANAAAERLHGPLSEVGRRVADIVQPKDPGFERLLDAINRPDGKAEARVRAFRADGTVATLGVRTTYDHETRRWYTVERDITAQVERDADMAWLTEILTHEARTDSLTGVASRAALDAELTAARKDRVGFALLMLDLDDFKSVNDTLGHAAGDEFLRRVAGHLKAAVRGDGLVARVGGDEFVVYLPGIEPGDAVQVAQMVMAVVGQRYTIEGVELSRSCSVGIAMSEPGEDVAQVMRKADRAAYAAKHQGRSRFCVFDEQPSPRVEQPAVQPIAV